MFSYIAMHVIPAGPVSVVLSGSVLSGPFKSDLSAIRSRLAHATSNTRGTNGANSVPQINKNIGSDGNNSESNSYNSAFGSPSSGMVVVSTTAAAATTTSPQRGGKLRSSFQAFAGFAAPSTSNASIQHAESTSDKDSASGVHRPPMESQLSTDALNLEQEAGLTDAMKYFLESEGHILGMSDYLIPAPKVHLRTYVVSAAHQTCDIGVPFCVCVPCSCSFLFLKGFASRNGT
jgi:hypothetical protein